MRSEPEYNNRTQVGPLAALKGQRNILYLFWRSEHWEISAALLLRLLAYTLIETNSTRSQSIALSNSVR